MFLIWEQYFSDKTHYKMMWGTAFSLNKKTKCKLKAGSSKNDNFIHHRQNRRWIIEVIWLPTRCSNHSAITEWRHYHPTWYFQKKIIFHILYQHGLSGSGGCTQIFVNETFVSSLSFCHFFSVFHHKHVRHDRNKPDWRVRACVRVIHREN